MGRWWHVERRIKINKTKHVHSFAMNYCPHMVPLSLREIKKLRGFNIWAYKHKYMAIELESYNTESNAKALKAKI
jgi:hypothetical protein